jgi:hypothetical protein
MSVTIPNTKSAKAIRMLAVAINHIFGADIPQDLLVNAMNLLHSIAMADALKRSDDILEAGEKAQELLVWVTI